MIIRKQPNSNPVKYYNKNNKKCPSCKNPMLWVEGLVDDSTDITLGKYCCESCKTFYKPEESRAVKKGRALAKKINISTFKLEDINNYSTATQLGILRELQHGRKGYLR